MSNNVRWRLWASISINASSTVTEARTITAQSGKFRASRSATGVSRVATGVWIVRLQPGEALSADQCIAVCTPRHTQILSAAAAPAVSGAVTCAVTHDSQVAKRITIVATSRAASGAGTSYGIPARQNVPFDLCLYRMVE